jgi:damage-control phosphatase, subfamily I
MQARPECFVCMFKQALNTIRLVTPDETLHRRALEALGARLPALDLAQTPAALSRHVYAIVSELTGVADPYRALKQETNRLALALLPRVRPLVERAADPLDAALHLAAAGNIIDAGIGHAFDIERDVETLMHTAFAVSALERFRTDLRPGRRLLYVGDNAGEIVFDAVLVERIQAAGVVVTVSVKSGPIINDATMEDAQAAGLPALCRVIETGSDDIGVNFARASAEFRREFDSADIVLAKGHGNFETCEDRPGNLYFLLKAKCPLVAEAAGIKLGDLFFAHVSQLPVAASSSKRHCA